MNDGQIRSLVADSLAHRHCVDCGTALHGFLSVYPDAAVYLLSRSTHVTGGPFCRDCFLRHEGPLKK